MSAYCYILKCADGSFYTGSTRNIETRLWQHQNGFGGRYTQQRLPVKLVYYEEYQNVAEAFAREKQIQKWSKRKKWALINDYEPTLRQFASSSD